MLRTRAVVSAAVLSCGCAAEKRCLAQPNRSPDDIGYALSIVCDPARLDCSPIGFDNTTNTSGAHYWPNTIYAHANWAFDQYWQAQGSGAVDFCSGNGKGIPPGQANVFDCSASCERCQVKSGTDTNSSYNIVGYLCNGYPQIMGPLCGPVADGGAMENATAQEKASHVMDLYYQPIRCDIGASACDFGGKGEVVSC